MSKTLAPAIPAIVRSLQQVIREHYLDPTAGNLIAAELDRADDVRAADPAELAMLLTDRLRAASPDLHLRVAHVPDRATGTDPTDPDPEPESWTARFARESAENAGGIRSVQRLDAATGMLEIAPYTSPIHLARPFVAAAFALLADVQRLIIDVREGHGGTPETVALICGYLLDSEPIHLQDIVSRDGTRKQFWTSPQTGRLGPEVSVAVLTSSTTFSGCEELAYNLQALGRATVIGETTRGGAHPVEVFALGDGLQARIPVAASVNAVTGGNWEQVGVVPDRACPAADALLTALRV